MPLLRHLVLALLLVPMLLDTACATERLRLATSGSADKSGLLQALLPPFEKGNNCRVEVLAVGTGKAIRLGETGEADVILVHSRKNEDAFVAEGYGTSRRDVMYNDFVIVGPASDPAHVRSAVSACDALKRIAAARLPFVSRAEDSGCRRKEKELWQTAGVRPCGPWYHEAEGMAKVLATAGDLSGYALTDRGTYNAVREKSQLRILFQGQKGLFNPYGVIAVNPKRHPQVNYRLAEKFIDYLTGPEGQSRIAGFRVKGEPIFFTYPSFVQPPKLTR